MIFSKLADRGFNQSEFLATLLSEKWNLKVERKGLLKMKNTTSQTKLTEKERLFNLRGAFKWNENTALPKKIILIDDVYTTGSTLEECAKVLVERGAEKVVAWTLFRTPKIY